MIAVGDGAPKNRKSRDFGGLNRRSAIFCKCFAITLTIAHTNHIHSMQREESDGCG
jgi:hypothetical protein